MPRNMGTIDRALRVFVAVPVLTGLSLGVFGVGSVLGIVALALAVVMLATSAIGFCPLYAPLGLSTCARKSDGNRVAVQR